LSVPRGQGWPEAIAGAPLTRLGADEDNLAPEEVAGAVGTGVG